MASLRWILLFAGVVFIAGVYLFSRDWFQARVRSLFARKPKPLAVPLESGPEVESELQSEPEPDDDVVETPRLAPLKPDTKVVAVRIIPQQGQMFPAEELVLALRAQGLQHGQFGIFHRYDETSAERIRYSIASLVEPGSFDLTNLKNSEYEGVSVFLLLPAADDGVSVFDEMIFTARAIAKEINGQLIDVEGSAFSLQRERYMREEVIEHMRLQNMDNQMERYSGI